MLIILTTAPWPDPSAPTSSLLTLWSFSCQVSFCKTLYSRGASDHVCGEGLLCRMETGMFGHFHINGCDTDRLVLSQCCEIRHHLHCLVGFQFFKCSGLIPSMLVSLDIRFNLKIEIASPVSNTQHKNKLLCIRATGHPLPLFPLWPEDKQINGWISATCRSLQGHPGDCIGNSILIFFFLFQSLWANSERKHLNLPVQISRHYNKCQSDIELMRCNQAVLMFNSVEILPSANKLRMTNATAFWVNRHSF